MEGVRVQPVGLWVGQEIPHPRFEVGKGDQPLDMIDDYHGELNAVLGPEVDALAGEDLVDRFVEVWRVDQTDQVRYLIETIRLIEGPEPVELVARGKLVAVRPLAGDLNGVCGEQCTEPSAEVRRGSFRSAPRMDRRFQKANEQGSAKVSGLVVDLLFRCLDEDVRGSHLVGRQLTVTGAEGEVSVPRVHRSRESDQEAGPSVAVVCHESYGTSAFTRDGHGGGRSLRSTPGGDGYEAEEVTER